MLTKKEIIQELETQYQNIIAEVSALNNEEFVRSIYQKWAAGQHLEHLCQSIRPLVLGLKLPNFMPKLLFGKARRPSKTYPAIVEQYTSKIKAGAKATVPFIPSSKVPFTKKEALCKRLQKLVESLVKALGNYQEEQLDVLRLPHPILGKITLREMMYFTVYHAKHHHRLILNSLD